MNRLAITNTDDWRLIQSMADRHPWFSADAVDATPIQERDAQLADPPTPAETTEAANAENTQAVIIVSFQGRGVGRVNPSTGQAEFSNLHRVQIRLPNAYPEKPPGIQFQSDLFHPNVSVSGLVHLSELGLVWQPGITLDIVCERIWDVIRGAYVDSETATNSVAGRWYREQTSTRFPLDSRSLQDDKQPMENIVSYRRKDRRQRVTVAPEVMIISDTPGGQRTGDEIHSSSREAITELSADATPANKNQSRTQEEPLEESQDGIQFLN